MRAARALERRLRVGDDDVAGRVGDAALAIVAHLVGAQGDGAPGDRHRPARHHDVVVLVVGDLLGVDGDLVLAAGPARRRGGSRVAARRRPAGP